MEWLKINWNDKTNFRAFCEVGRWVIRKLTLRRWCASGVFLSRYLLGLVLLDVDDSLLCLENLRFGLTVGSALGSVVAFGVTRMASKRLNLRLRVVFGRYWFGVKGMDGVNGEVMIIFIMCMFLVFWEAWSEQDKICTRIAQWKHGKREAGMKLKFVCYRDQNLRCATLVTSFSVLNQS